MSTKPILFSTPMVQAILDGKKTMTRRVIKPQPDCPYVGFDNWRDSPKNAERLGKIRKMPCAPGDILWVRETWAVQECEKCRAGMPALGGECRCDFVYRTNYGKTEDDSFPPSMFRWEPSIHMPREAARIFLRVKDVRVERVQDISAEDCEAEGYFETAPVEPRPRSWFSTVWDALNAKRGYGWDKNPYVWVYRFERVDKPAGWPGGEGEG